MPYPNGDLWVVLVFAVCPIAFSILILSLAMVRMYVSVRAQSWSSNEASSGFGESATIEQAVFRQAVFYTISFYITWPIVLCVYVTGWDFEKKNFGFSVVVALVAPLQGFNNSLVYARRDIAKCLRDFIQNIRDASARPQSASPSSLYGGRDSTRKNYDSMETPGAGSSETPGGHSTESRGDQFMDSQRRYSCEDPSVTIADDGEAVLQREPAKKRDDAFQTPVAGLSTTPLDPSSELADDQILGSRRQHSREDPSATIAEEHDAVLESSMVPEA